MIKVEKLFRSAACVMTIVLTVPLSAAAQSATYENPIEPERTPEINLGKTMYDFFCASCHGETAGGSDKGPTFINRIYHPGHHGDQAFSIAPVRGAKAHHWQFGDMPPVEGVTDAQLESILGYIRAIQHANGVF